MSKRNARRGKFRFELHSDYTVGPNRTTNDSKKAMTYFTRIKHRGYDHKMLARIFHIPSGLFVEAHTLEELDEFINKVVDPLNARK